MGFLYDRKIETEGNSIQEYYILERDREIIRGERK
jgi:hypothetical protein